MHNIMLWSDSIPYILSFMESITTARRLQSSMESLFQKGATVIVPIALLHFNTVYWKDPEEIDPDRLAKI